MTRGPCHRIRTQSAEFSPALCKIRYLKFLYQKIYSKQIINKEITYSYGISISKSILANRQKKSSNDGRLYTNMNILLGLGPVFTEHDQRYEQKYQH